MKLPLLLLAITFALFLAACGTEEEDPCPGGEVLYWHDPMVPEEHFDEPGPSPFMDMDLVPVCSEGSTGDTSQAADGEREILYWYDPMHPEEHFDKPGKSPFMDMELVPMYADEAVEAEGTVRIDPVTLQNLGVKTAPVVIGQLERELRTTGTFAFDESTQEIVTLRVSGWIEELYVDKEGQRVSRGKPIAEVYSPDLVSTQEEHLLALRNREALGESETTNRLVQASRRRLELFEVSAEQIRRLEETGEVTETITVYAPASGTVVRKPVVQGMQVRAGQELLEIVNVGRLWLQVNVPEADLSWVTVGTRARIQVEDREGEAPITGRVGFIYDDIDPMLRTGRARIVVPNPGDRLKDGMYATATLFGTPTEPSTLVPTDAVIRESDASAVVIVARGDGRFEPRRVHVGRASGGQTQILGGLNEGERVVTSAQFLIDSEARLSGALAAMEPADTTEEMDMEGMEMRNEE